MKQVLWQNYDLSEMFEEEKEYWKQKGEEVREDIMWDIVYDSNDEELSLIREQFSTLSANVICIARLGLWNGTVWAYKDFGEVTLDELLSSKDDYIEWYCDAYNFKATGSHHDGNNIYLYREWKEGISEDQKENFMGKIYKNKVTYNDISRYTKSLKPMLDAFYGW